MISQEPVIRVGIFEQYQEVRGELVGRFNIDHNIIVHGEFHAVVESGEVVMYGGKGIELLRAREIRCIPSEDCKFVLHDVAIGINFHWERRESQRFEGGLTLLVRENGTITAINEVPVEKYLTSVISSEMSAEAPIELLKAQAITSRSWLVAMLEQKQRHSQFGVPSQRTHRTETELTRWYDREDHDVYDVCADDHCQRYHGVSKIISEAAREAVAATRGVFLVHGDEICDARFSKACGGRTELFEHAWADTPVPYLTSVSDASVEFAPVNTTDEVRAWIISKPDAYCNTTHGAVLRQVLPSFDRETTDFFRWSIRYTREELEELIFKKSGFDFGTLTALTPLERGPSGRIYRLKIEGTKLTLTVGKELEIRRWLSHSHLYSSAFIIETERAADGTIAAFTFKGGGWGHGVGLCQIGAAVMAIKGFVAEEIVNHYFRNAHLATLY
ncbi:MAG TPA: SpoIID/LytB domain-containing protein [Bacteroidota bacterium]|nr:SpoIID/LytB domain-containing protein [Bacteroidota bacterium]